MRIIDLSAPIAPSPPGVLPFERIEIAYSSHAEGAGRSKPFSTSRPACCVTAKAGRSRNSRGSVPTASHTSMPPGTTTAGSRDGGPPRSTSFRWNGSLPTASSST